MVPSTGVYVGEEPLFRIIRYLSGKSTASSNDILIADVVISENVKLVGCKAGSGIWYMANRDDGLPPARLNCPPTYILLPPMAIVSTGSQIPVRNL